MCIHLLALTSDAFAQKIGDLCHKKPPAAIALYTFPASPFSRPPADQIRAFVERLRTHRLLVFVRQERGTPIRAACGQLGGNP